MMRFDDYKFTSVEVLRDKILSQIDILRYEDNDALLFYTVTGEYFLMTHRQDCCEQVILADIVGDLNDLIGEPLLIAEEANSTLHALLDPGPLDESAESFTWTFYKFATIKGYVDLRWYGTSNGYYSESVSFLELIGFHP